MERRRGRGWRGEGLDLIGCCDCVGRSCVQAGCEQADEQKSAERENLHLYSSPSDGEAAAAAAVGRGGRNVSQSQATGVNLDLPLGTRGLSRFAPAGAVFIPPLLRSISFMCQNQPGDN